MSTQALTEAHTQAYINMNPITHMYTQTHTQPPDVDGL